MSKRNDKLSRISYRDIPEILDEDGLLMLSNEDFCKYCLE